MNSLHMLESNFGFLIDFIFLCALAYYLMTNLQWYNYSIARVVSKHHKPQWHFLYFVLPIVAYCLGLFAGWIAYFYIVLIFLYFPALIYWAYKLDKPLKWTGRVWRFFGIFVLCAVIDLVLSYVLFDDLHNDWFLIVVKMFVLFILTFVCAIFISNFAEEILFNHYKKLAQQKIASMTQLKIVLITASYGKTSIKNYLYQILKARFATYATPRSVNTLKGIVLDINTNLDLQTDFYIVEAGARLKGDIAQISEFLNPQFVIIGKIGPQHLEYFKTLENIVETKFEAMQTNRLKYALIESSNAIPMHYKNSVHLASEVKNIQASLNGTKFELMLDGEWYRFETSVLGSFNAHNIALCIEMARMIGLNIQEIANRVRRLESVPHRLSKSEVGGRIILDDSFNGNIEGMKEAIRISSWHNGRKVIVTPGVVESTDEINIDLAREIDKYFDVVIITGELNAQVLSKEIKRAKKILLKDKSLMENMLKITLKDGDLVLFANDAPNYI